MFGVYLGHQNSLFGRNVSFCSEHFSLNVNDLIFGNVSTQLVHNICLGRRTVSSYCNALGVFELPMLKRNILAVPGCDFTVRDIDVLIQSIVTICVNFRFFYLFFILYVLRVRFYNNNYSGK